MGREIDVRNHGPKIHYSGSFPQDWRRALFYLRPDFAAWPEGITFRVSCSPGWTVNSRTAMASRPPSRGTFRTLPSGPRSVTYSEEAAFAGIVTTTLSGPETSSDRWGKGFLTSCWGCRARGATWLAPCTFQGHILIPPGGG